MLLTFSPAYSADHSLAFCGHILEAKARFHVAKPPLIAWTRRMERGQLQIRFTLPGATSEQHTRVIAELLKLDAGAEIRTAKGVFRNEVVTP